MHRANGIVILGVAALLCLASAPGLACTNYLVTKGASADGSTMITYAADSHVLYGELYYSAPGRHAPGTLRDVYEWDTGKYLGKIAEAPVTYSVVGNMNEHQVSIGETTWGGRKELRDPKAIVDYGSLMYIALQRAKTAREAIQVMTSLVAEYGYASSGETFSIADANEVWIMDLIGKGLDNKGAVWVVRRVPEGYISGHANAPRIRQFPLNDAQNTLYSPDVITFARNKGWYTGSDKDFSFADTYSPPRFGAQRACDSRVWCMFNRARPSDPINSDWVKGVDGAEPLPLWIKPDHKLTVVDVMRYMRDHFEGTDLDMTMDIGAGPYQLPYRWRPMGWKVDGVEYLHERATSTQQTGFSFVAQARSWLPNPIGGVLWFGVDDTYSTVYFPAYCGATAVPHSYAVGNGSFTQFTWDSAFWVFNWVSNYAYLRYSEMIQDIQVVQRELEDGFLAEQAEVDAAALALHQQAPRLARDYLTQYSQRSGDAVVARWRKLGEQLLYKYLDGNVKNELGEVKHPPYPEAWYRAVAAATGDRLKSGQLESEKREAEAAAAKKKEEAQGMSQGILVLLGSRGIGVDDATRKTIETTEDVDKLKGWLVRAATATSVGEVLAP